MIALACLDMAGTTVRDAGLVDAAFAEAMSAVGLAEPDFPAAKDHVHRTMGLPKEVVFRSILNDDARARDAVAVFDASVLREVRAGRVEEQPGAAKALEELRRQGIAICLTTGFTSVVQAAIVDHLGWGQLVDLMLAPAPGIRGRPFPDLVLTAVLRLEVDDVRAVAVAGDTANDLTAAYRAGAGVIAGVLSGAHTRAELEAAPHTHILETIAGLPAVISGAAATPSRSKPAATRRPLH
jgi:phosphonatase-like hydrolase